MRNIQMSDYTVGEDCFDAIPAALASYRAKSVVLVGGKRALSAAAPMILKVMDDTDIEVLDTICLLYTSPSPRDRTRSRMPSSA